MRIVLRQDLADVGKKGDILDVSDGYARNYLLPKGLALKATSGAEFQARAMRRARDVKDARERSAAEDIARRLVPTVVRIPARAGSEGRLFGSVTTTDVVEAVQAQTGIELDRRRLHLDEPIKTLGAHQVPAKLHAEVEFVISVEVTAG